MIRMFRAIIEIQTPAHGTLTPSTKAASHAATGPAQSQPAQGAGHTPTPLIHQPSVVHVPSVVHGTKHAADKAQTTPSLTPETSVVNGLHHAAGKATPSLTPETSVVNGLHHAAGKATPSLTPETSVV
eukprot:CAMPEP_0173058942 /NCGR_PEP_ID=MMETSP1102-20130122/1660_1 /TAXON_ID=49646 /ORGANISM="Geminigera sp., Strain Caron Lab Isolate" /LENGTH=127 /DNA_ID=CAMNT_0013924793 /DNA_START=264 /DNA_END=644 /DNA_ORIENTATION=+